MSTLTFPSPYPLSAADQLRLLAEGWSLCRARHEDYLVQRIRPGATRIEIRNPDTYDSYMGWISHLNRAEKTVLATRDWKLTPQSEVKLIRAGYLLVRPQEGRLWILREAKGLIRYEAVPSAPQGAIMI